MEKHADLRWAFTYDFSDAVAELAGGSADVAVVALSQLPYPLPEKVQVVALLGDDHVLLSRDRRPHLQACFYGEDLRRLYGKVWLIGMGPGDPELMTFKADHALRRANVIFYDSLIDPSVLGRYFAHKVHVGKRKGNHTQQQEAINELLAAAARKGNIIARLKGGDPFIFGRGGEEVEYLRRRLVAVEVVPGVSAANGAAASVSVPLTKRGVSRSLVFETVHEGSAPASDSPTRVFFMGASRLRQLSRRLLHDGLDPRTPVILVHNASSIEERSVTTNVFAMGALDLHSPLMVLVGDVARERRTEGQCLFTGTDPYAFRCPERVIHCALTAAGTPKRISLDRFVSVAFVTAETVDQIATLNDGLSTELLYYCASTHVQARVRMYAPTAATVLCCCR
jgi:uroporphyrin-III C-methyltransferase